MKLNKGYFCKIGETEYLEFELTSKENDWFANQQHQADLLSLIPLNLFSNDPKPFLLDKTNNKLFIINTLDFSYLWSSYEKDSKPFNNFLLKTIDQLIDAHLINLNEAEEILKDAKSLTATKEMLKQTVIENSPMVQMDRFFKDFEKIAQKAYYFYKLENTFEKQVDVAQERIIQQLLGSQLYLGTKDLFNKNVDLLTSKEKGELLRRYWTVWKETGCIRNINDTEYATEYQKCCSFPYPEASPMMAGFNLQNTDFNFINVSDLVFLNVNFKNSRFFSTTLSNCDFLNCDFSDIRNVGRNNFSTSRFNQCINAPYSSNYDPHHFQNVKNNKESVSQKVSLESLENSTYRPPLF